MSVVKKLGVTIARLEQEEPRIQIIFVSNNCVFIGPVGLNEASEEVYAWRRIGDLKLIGHYAKRPIFTRQIQLPFDKKYQLSSGSCIAQIGWNEGMNQNIMAIEYKSVDQKAH